MLRCIRVCLVALVLASNAAARELVVTATAYNSLPGQTDSTPNLAAWNNPLFPGMRAIAVSRDLIPLGIGNQVVVEVVGYGFFTVLDKMNKRYKGRIDVYYGDDVEAARKFGKRQVRVVW